MELRFDRPFINIFTKGLCAMAGSDHARLRVEIRKGLRLEGAEDFFAVNPAAMEDFIMAQEGKAEHDIYVHLGDLQPDFLKTRTPALNDFRSIFGFVTDGSSDSIHAASGLGKARIDLPTSEGTAAAHFFDRPQAPSVLQNLGERVIKLNRQRGGNSHNVSVALPIPGTVHWPRRTGFGPSDGDLKLAALGFPTVSKPVLVMPTFPAAA